MRSFFVSCVLLVLLAVGTPMAHTAEIQQPEEHLSLELRRKTGFVVYFQLEPQLHVAVVSSQKGGDRLGGRRNRWLGAAYAAHAPAADLSGQVHLGIGHVGILRGHFVADGLPRRGHHNHFCRGRPPLFESGHFVGRIVFRGAGGYLTVHAHQARAYRSRSFRLRCARGTPTTNTTSSLVCLAISPRRWTSQTRTRPSSSLM